MRRENTEDGRIGFTDHARTLGWPLLGMGIFLAGPAVVLPQDSHRGFGLVLAALLILAGVAALRSSIRLELDPKRRVLVETRRRLFGMRVREIPFGEITRFEVGLRTGRHGTGGFLVDVYEGQVPFARIALRDIASDASAVRALAEELAQLTGAEVSESTAVANVQKALRARQS